MIDLRPAAERTLALITSTADSQLREPTPSGDACVGAVIDHLGLFAVRFRASARKDSFDEAAETRPPDVDNLEVGWRDRIAHDLLALADAWRDPQAWEGDTTAGGMTLPADVVGLVALDELIVHGWDIASATGQPYDPTEEEIEGAMSFVSSFPAPRDGTLFGPVVPVANDAPPLDRLLGLTGRDPQWQSRQRSDAST